MVLDRKFSLISRLHNARYIPLPFLCLWFGHMSSN